MSKSAVMLSEDTYKRLMKMLEKWEKGDIVTAGEGLTTLETGTGYQKIGGNFKLQNIAGFGFNTLNVNVCIDGSPVSKTFLTTIG